MTGLFDQVGLRTKEGKMVSMACRPCHTPHVWSTEAYTWKMMGRGLSYRERIRQRVNCPECRVDMASSSLAAHRQQQQKVGSGKATPPSPPRGVGLRIGTVHHNSTWFSFRLSLSNLGALWRDDGVKSTHGKTSGNTLPTNTLGTAYSSWRREINPNPGAPSVACLFHRKTSISNVPARDREEAKEVSG